jgi:hypothetical protein
MKQLTLLFLVLSLSIASCKKAIEEKIVEKKIDAVMVMMTANTWKCESFLEDGRGNNEIMNQSFNFSADMTVKATKGGVVLNGNWGADQATMTTSANFPSTVPQGFLSINGNWQIIRTSSYYVEAKQEVGGVNKFMRLIRE